MKKVDKIIIKSIDKFKSSWYNPNRKMIEHCSMGDARKK